jgi:hypothetical protein
MMPITILCHFMTFSQGKMEILCADVNSLALFVEIKGLHDTVGPTVNDQG